MIALIASFYGRGIRLAGSRFCQSIDIGPVLRPGRCRFSPMNFQFESRTKVPNHPLQKLLISRDFSDLP